MLKNDTELFAELLEAVSNYKLNAVADQLFENASECYAMVVTAEEDYSSTGNTRFGGDPDLPESIPWPCDGDPNLPQSRFSNFIAQINFSEFPPLTGDFNLFPNTGILFLFVRYMESASEPVTIDSVFFNGNIELLQRTPSPPKARLSDEGLVDLRPKKIVGVPAISIAAHRKELKNDIQKLTDKIDEKDGSWRFEEMQNELRREGQIGQLYGFANSDPSVNLYRQVCLGKIEKRPLIYNDYWDSIEEYEAAKEKWPDLADFYERMREGVNWLMQNQEMISEIVAEWNLLFQIDSNKPMNLWMMDADPLYIFVRDVDLENLDFTNMAGEITQG